MSFRLLAFGVARESIGSEIVVDKTDIRDVQCLRNWLALTYPHLHGMSKWAIAVNEQYANDLHPIVHGDVVAVIPPVSGG